MGVEVIYAPFFLSPSEYLSIHAGDFDAFYISRYYVAQDVMPQLRALAPETRIIFNNADLHFLREIRAAQADGDPAMLEKAMRTRTEELAIIRQVDAILSYNDVEHSVINAYTDGQSRVLRCPWVVDIPEATAGIEGRSGMSFLGSFKHHPNEAAVRWFAKEIAPLLPDDEAYRLSIYGAGMNSKIRALESPKIDPVGFVEQIASAFDRHRIFVAPLLSGAGIKGKVLSALAHGVPCVLTPIAAEGIGLRSGHDCLIVETPEEWRIAITRLMEDDGLWQAMADNAMSYVRESFSFAKGREHMRKAFEAVDLFRSLP
ncbi:glycosyltransferase family 4 protein [Thioclava sp. BHET1]|nr:glycosyltransferase family 4 protein [Thioclava sp. BHET1]